MLKSPWPYKLFLLAVFGLAYCLFYVVPGFHPAFVPAGLPISTLEKHIPFLPWTILIYTSDYLFMAFVVGLLTDRFEFHRFARLTLLVLIFGGFFFWFFPTVLPDRMEYLEDETFLVRFLLYLVRLVDAPTNCFPSMHVAFTGVGLWSLRSRSRGVFRTFFFWATLITLSVLTTKRHYFWDILGGIGLVVAAVHLDRWLSQFAFVRHWVFLWESTDWWDYTFRMPRPRFRSRPRRA